MQQLDGRGLARLAQLCTHDAVLGSYDRLTLYRGTASWFSQETTAAVPGAGFCFEDVAVAGLVRRTYQGIYDLDRCTDRVAAAKAWALLSRTPAAEAGTLVTDGVIAVGYAGSVRWVPAPWPGVDLNAHVDATLASGDRLAGPAFAQVWAAAQRALGGRGVGVIVNDITLERVLAEWDPQHCEERMAQARLVRADADASQVPSASVEVGPLMLLATESKGDWIGVAWASGQYGAPDMHVESMPALVACDLWTGPQDADTAAAYAELRDAGLSPQDAVAAMQPRLRG